MFFIRSIWLPSHAPSSDEIHLYSGGCDVGAYCIDDDIGSVHFGSLVSHFLCLVRRSGVLDGHESSPPKTPTETV